MKIVERRDFIFQKIKEKYKNYNIFVGIESTNFNFAT